ncbi:MAG: hypothetical protein AAF581_04055 [Planctomycetota bacterium]
MGGDDTLRSCKDPAPARIYGILAREAPVAVLFRRGPSQYVQVIRWDTEADTFEQGQWFYGRIYEHRGDLTPDGKYMVYFAASRSREREKHKQTWTAVSKPPWLTALAMWWKGDSWSGGGLFPDGRTLMLNDPKLEFPFVEEPKVPGCPFGVGTLLLSVGEEWPIEAERLERDGWGFTETESGHYILRKSHDGYVLTAYPQFRYNEYTLTSPGGQVVVLNDIPWAEWDQRGRLVAARKGCVLAASPEEAVAGEWTELIDLSPNKPNRRKSPSWARSW